MRHLSGHGSMKRFSLFLIYPAVSLALHTAGVAVVGLAGMMWSGEEARGGGAVAPVAVAAEERIYINYQIMPAEAAPEEPAKVEIAKSEEPVSGPPSGDAISAAPVLPEMTPPIVDRLYNPSPADPRPAPARASPGKPAAGQMKANAQSPGKRSLRREGADRSVPTGFLRHASATYAPEPVYPSDARRRRVQGSVVVRIAVSAAGRTERAWVERSSGHAELDQAALSAAQKMRCVPAMRDGQATAEQLRRTYTFRLK